MIGEPQYSLQKTKYFEYFILRILIFKIFTNRVLNLANLMLNVQQMNIEYHIMSNRTLKSKVIMN